MFTVAVILLFWKQTNVNRPIKLRGPVLECLWIGVFLSIPAPENTSLKTDLFNKQQVIMFPNLWILMNKIKFNWLCLELMIFAICLVHKWLILELCFSLSSIASGHPLWRHVPMKFSRTRDKLLISPRCLVLKVKVLILYKYTFNTKNFICLRLLFSRY